MERYSKLLWVVVVLTAASCADPAVQPDYPMGENERRLLGDWQYTAIIVTNSSGMVTECGLATDTNEPYVPPQRSERDAIKQRWIYYSETQNYQLRWNRSTYQLGTDGDPNWQPSFGSWSMNETGDLLYHNKGTNQEVTYQITIHGDILTRTSQRYMSSSSGNRWSATDIVTFREVFVRMD